MSVSTSVLVRFPTQKHERGAAPFYKVNLNNFFSWEKVHSFSFLEPTFLYHVSLCACFLYCSSASWNALELPWCFPSPMSILSNGDLFWIRKWGTLSLARPLQEHPALLGVPDLVEIKRGSSPGGPKPATVPQIASSTGIHKIIESLNSLRWRDIRGHFVQIPWN